MKQFVTLTLCWLLLLIPQTHFATEASPSTFEPKPSINKFGLKVKGERERKVNEKRTTKIKKTKKTGGFNDLNKYLRLSIIFLIGAIVAGILQSIGGLGFFWIIALGFGLAAVAFFILWILVEFG